MRHRISTTVILFSLLAVLSVWAPGRSVASGLPSGRAFRNLVASDVTSGLITPEEALLLRFQYGFAPDELPARYHVVGFSPLACATELIAEYYSQRARLTMATVTRIDGWLQPGADKTQYLSPSGHFRLTYSVSGVDSVPALDVSPANGVPDYVEKAALYCDRAWAVTVDSLGFQAPQVTPYAVSFESMQYYGYTAVVSSVTGETRIVLHNNYLGFPDNDDPEGVVAGAARVTAAHEFKHATQYATSSWSEGGWNELDATWMEDVVYDQVNDYYNYLTGESPLRQPEIPLDGGMNTTGSYEDCVWQTFLTEQWGLAICQDFWTRRALFPLEIVMETYRHVLNSRGVSLAEAWSLFTAWNYGVGVRKVPGLGYEEGAAYPSGPVLDTATIYPYDTAGNVEHLAAQVVAVAGFDPGDTDLLHIVFDGQGGVGPLTLAVHVTRWDGSGLIETVALDAANNADHMLSVPVREIRSAAVIVGNAATFGLAVTWNLDLSLEPIPAQPLAAVSPSVLTAAVVSGGQGQVSVRLSNSGETGSALTYAAQVWTTDPDGAPAGPAGTKSVAGSSFNCDRSTYLPGELLNLNFLVFNGSTDEEWLSDLSLDFPAGVLVLVSSDFVGGSLGDLVGDGRLGDGVQVTWHGEYGAQQYGVLRSGESAQGTVQVMAVSGFSGDLTIGWTLQGDNYGATPHQLAGVITLAEGSPQLTLTSPNGGEVYAVGDTIPVTWDTGGSLSLVDLDLSRDGGQTWAAVAGAIPNNGAHDLVLNGPPSNRCLLRVGSVDGSVVDAGDNTFQLYTSPVWAAVSPGAGLLGAGEFSDLQMDLNASGLLPGNYQAWLVVQTNALAGRVVVPVELAVTSALAAVDSPPVFVVRGAYPNPFNPRTTVVFALPQAAATTVDVLDVRGHLVRRLFEGRLPAGGHQRVWDGHDDRGLGVSAGVYLVRVRAGNQTGTTKILLAK